MKPNQNLKPVNEAYEKTETLYESELVGEKDDLLGSLTGGFGDSGLTSESDAMANNMLGNMDIDMKIGAHDDDVDSILSNDVSGIDFIGNFNKNKKNMGREERVGFSKDKGRQGKHRQHRDSDNNHSNQDSYDRIGVNKSKREFDDSFSSESKELKVERLDSQDCCEYEYDKENDELDQDRLLGDSLTKVGSQVHEVKSQFNEGDSSGEEPGFGSHSFEEEKQVKQGRGRYEDSQRSISNGDVESADSRRERRVKNQHNDLAHESPNKNLKANDYLQPKSKFSNVMINTFNGSSNLSVQGTKGNGSENMNLDNSDSFDREIGEQSLLRQNGNQIQQINQQTERIKTEDKNGIVGKFNFSQKQQASYRRGMNMSNKEIPSKKQENAKVSGFGGPPMRPQDQVGFGGKAYIGSVGSHSDMGSDEDFNRDIDLDMRDDMDFGFGRHERRTEEANVESEGKPQIEANNTGVYMGMGEEDNLNMEEWGTERRQLEMEIAELQRETDMRDSRRDSRREQQEKEFQELRGSANIH